MTDAWTDAHLIDLYWRAFVLGALLLLGIGALVLRIQIDRLQTKMDITVQLLLTWARLWGRPEAEVRLALTGVLDATRRSRRDSRPDLYR